MTNAINLKRNSTSRYNKCSSLIFFGLAFFFLLLLRDTYSVGINKNIFILITCICAVTMKTNYLVYLFCFLFPLYVGLPGNYMTLVLIARMLFDFKQFKLKMTSFVLTFLISVFVFCQNLLVGSAGIVPMMFVVGVVFVLLLFSYNEKFDTTPMIVMYCAGVAALGFIMLASTLQVYDFSDLLSTSFRLGAGNVNYAESGAMNVSVDPNFYGTFSISAIATAVPLLFKSETKLPVKIALYCFSVVSLVVSLIGLSRTFLIVLIAWIILYLLSQKNIKGAVAATVAIASVIILVCLFMPDVLQVILARFEDSDMATGNGRFTLVTHYFELWQENIITVLFGIGLYKCTVHCMPLQFLFGGGIILFLFMFFLFISYRNTKNIRQPFAGILPILLTFVMMCAVPAAGLLNFMFPLIFIGFLMKNDYMAEGVQNEKA